jgi:DNA-binding XRE family transcriptional regulator
MGEIKLRIKELMAKIAGTRDELANYSGVTTASISSMTSGKNNPSMKVLVKMAVKFDMNIRDLFEPSNVTLRELDEAKALINRALDL